MECVNCGGRYTTARVRHAGGWRWWCSYCGGWADRLKAKW